MFAVSVVLVVIIAFSATWSWSMDTRRNQITRCLVMRDYPKPAIENTRNYREAAELSSKFVEWNRDFAKKNSKKKVAVIGGGLSGIYIHELYLNRMKNEQDWLAESISLMQDMRPSFLKQEMFSVEKFLHGKIAMAIGLKLVFIYSSEHIQI